VATVQLRLGQDAEAKQNYHHALETLRRLVAEFPNDADYCCSLARCLSWQAFESLHPSYLEMTEDNVEAFREANQLQEKLVAKYPTRTDYQRDLADNYDSLAYYAFQHERLDEAEKLYRSACTLSARLAKENPTVMVYRLGFCQNLGQLGCVIKDTGRMQEAGEIWYESLERRKKLVADFPGLPQPRYCLGYGYKDLAQWQWAPGLTPWGVRYTGAASQNGAAHWQWDARRLHEASESYRQAVVVQARLASDFPGVSLYRTDLGRSYYELALVLSELRRMHEAEQFCRDALAIRENLARNHPAMMAQYAYEVGLVQGSLGRWVSDRGEPEAALALLDQAIAALKKVCTAEPQHHARNLLPYVCGYRAVALVRLRRFPEAEQVFRELEQTYADALARDPANLVNWICAALLRLQRGDREGYHRICRDMLARFRHTDDPSIAALTAQTWLLVPATKDLAPILELAERAITGTEQNFDYCWFLLVKGMADYRAGHFDRAVDRLNQTLSLSREARYLNTRPLSGMAHAFLAMEHQRLGRAAQARRTLQQEKELMEKTNAKIARDGSPEKAWHNWLRFHLIYQEAEALVKGEGKPRN
jgi:tetratricopeptide (TPR) repeat protein